MSKIIFYEKPGCKNNTKQKRILTLSGHEVEPVDLIQHPWTREELLSFFQGIEPKYWFNLNAPAFSDGEIEPDQFDEESAIEAMMKDHILIKRPLLIIGDTKLVGFDEEKIASLIGFDKEAHLSIEVMLADISRGCPNKNTKGKICSKYTKPHLK